MRAERGITLIALVITIIVMLILVAVTITMAINGGLFANAQDAGTKTNEAVKQEQNLASGFVNVSDTNIGTNGYDDINGIVNYYTSR